MFWLSLSQQMTLRSSHNHSLSLVSRSGPMNWLYICNDTLCWYLSQDVKWLFPLKHYELDTSDLSLVEIGHCSMAIDNWQLAIGHWPLATKARQFTLKSKTMLFDPKGLIFEATSMFRNIKFSKIIIDFNENIRFSWYQIFQFFIT